VLALVALGLAAVGVRLWTSDRGQALLVQWGVTSRFTPALATRLDVALAERFMAMGLVRGDLRARQVVLEKQRVREYRFSAPPHLTPTQCQIEIRRAAHGVYADVVRAERRHERGGELLLWLGFGSRLTHCVIVRPPHAQPPTAAAPKRGPRIALIIDDLGHNMNRTTRGFLDLGVPITVAVLPDLAKSRAAFDAARERGIPVLLHLPMQPDGDEDPGKRPITVGMSADEIDALIARHVERYQPFVGVNNHMGSRATADEATMRGLMQALRRRDLVFVDSQTTDRSLGAKTSRAAGVWCLRNDLFLDDRAEPMEQVVANLERLARLARKRGLAVGIAHPHRDTLRALRETIPRLQAEGLEFIHLDMLRPQAVAAGHPGAS
jgi:polysaccharide deacetylase 2 family uncharacterized protein YibQ